ncbi:MAG: hypothetical protein RJB13_1035 [Pseudomonadota bacterium]
MFKAIDKIHFIGIGGIGMSGLAEVLVNLGYQVSGSDLKESPIVLRLRSLGVKVYSTHASDNVSAVHVIVVSSAIPASNPEIENARRLKIPIIHRSEMLAELMRLKYGIIVAGTHGKTTTTSIMASALHDTNLDPTIVIGGVLNSSHSNAQLGTGDWFLAEADESDGSFLRLSPTIAVVTNIDRDHMDHYQSYQDILNAFGAFLDKVPFYGAVCACIDDEGVRKVLPSIRRRCITFGFNESADVQAVDVHTEGGTSRFTPLVFGQKRDPITLQMPGRYNILNALASVVVGVALDLDLDKVGQSISTFQGVLHRFTQIGQIGRITVVDDYAHNPKKISTVLSGIRESWPRHKVCAIFQPHRYSRVKHLGDEFADAFGFADHVIVTPVYSAGESPIDGCDHESLAERIRARREHYCRDTVLTCQNHEQAVSLAKAIANRHDGDSEGCSGVIVITLSAGDIQRLGHQFLEELNRM